MTTRVTGVQADMPTTKTPAIYYYQTDTDNLYYVDGTGATLQQFSAPDAFRRPLTFAENLTKGDAVRIQTNGTVIKADDDITNFAQTSFLNTGVSGTVRAIEVKDGGYAVQNDSDEIVFVRDDAGVLTSSLETNIGSDICGIARVDDDKIICFYTNEVNVVTIDWTTMAVSTGVSAFHGETCDGSIGGIIKIDGSNWVAYHAPSAGVLKKTYIEVIGINNDEAQVGSTVSTGLTVTAGSSVFDFNGDGGLIAVDGNGSGASNVKLSKVTVSGSTTSETVATTCSSVSGSETFCWVCPMSSSTSIAYTSGASDNNIFTASLIKHSDSNTPSVEGTIGIPVLKKIDSNSSTSLSVLLYRVTSTIFSMIYASGGTYYRREFRINETTRTVDPYSDDVLVGNGYSFSRSDNTTYSFGINNNGFSPYVSVSPDGTGIYITKQTDGLAFIDGFAHETGSSGENKFITLLGGIMEVDSAIVPAKNYYWDKTIGLNSVFQGVKIGRSISTTEINTSV